MVSLGKLRGTPSDIDVNYFLSIGPTNLTKGELNFFFENPHSRWLLSYTLYVGSMYPDNTSTIPTVTDNFYTEGTIAESVLSISFEPLTNTSVIATQMNGELTWGLLINYLKP